MLNQRRQYQSKELEQLDELYIEMVKLYDNLGTLLGGSSTGIQSLAAGDNITVDDTDPLNPIISVQDITLSGEVTGSTSLSAIDKTAITNKTTETIVGTDYVLISDTSDSGNLKKGLVSDLGGFDDGDFTLVASFKSLYNY